MQSFMFSLQFRETFGCGPRTVSGSQDRFVWERTCTGAFERREGLVQTVVVQETEDEHRAGQLFSFIWLCRRLDIFHSCEESKGLAVVFRKDAFYPDMEWEKRHLYFEQFFFFRWVEEQYRFFHGNINTPVIGDLHNVCAFLIVKHAGGKENI